MTMVNHGSTMVKTLPDHGQPWSLTMVQPWFNHGLTMFILQEEPSEFKCWPESFRKKVKEERKAPADRFAVSISGNYLMDVENEITVSQDEDMATEEKSDVDSETDYDCPSCKDLHQQLHDICLENIIGMTLVHSAINIVFKFLAFLKLEF